MPDRTMRTLLWLGALSCIVVGVGLLLATRLAPIKAKATSVVLANSFSTNAPTTKSDQPLVGTTDFKGLWKKKLQRPIVDHVKLLEKKTPTTPQPTKPKPKPKPLPPPIRLKAKLIGTLVDADVSFARAWIELQGKQQVVVPGDVLKGHPGNPTINSIHDRYVVVDIDEKSHTLALEQSPFSSSVITDSVIPDKQLEGDRVD